MDGVSFVVPVHNGAACVRDTIEGILAQADGSRPMEIIVVDDRSRDGSSRLLRRLAESRPIRIVPGEGRGAAAAINRGIRAAHYPIICQVDQDVVPGPGWLRRLLEMLEAHPRAAAVQGYYAADQRAGWCARAMALDLEQRYGAIASARSMDHVCTGNTAYRADALERVGLFDESFGYGYDNDMSYRLGQAGYRLLFCREARSLHRWREGLTSYAVQQYGFGYGRLDLVAKHPTRVGGDAVSPAGMMAHPLVTTAALACLTACGAMALAGASWHAPAMVAGVLLAGIVLERTAAGIGAAIRFGSATPLVFPFLHLVRNLAWVAAIAVWSGRRIAGRRSKPSHSMRARSTEVRTAAAARANGWLEPFGADAIATRRPTRILGLIPAHNEAASLPLVVAELRACRPDVDILVVDDGSTDETAVQLETLGVRWLRFPDRLGVGSAMRAGLRYATRARYDIVVRIDGDGQHRVDDVERLLAPIVTGAADVALGSRYTDPNENGAGLVRLLQRLLAACLSALTGQRVTDPTSGFCALGAPAVRLLAAHHPTGYSEPELRLLLNRNGLRTVEVPVRGRPRLGGRTSLTAARVVAAAARALLAMIIVPLRCRVAEAADD